MTDALELLRRSSRAVARDARTRYLTDLVKWPCRAEFDAIWRRVDYIPGWFNEGSAAVFYALMRSERPETIVEIGSYLGRSTVFFALALRKLGGSGAGSVGSEAGASGSGSGGSGPGAGPRVVAIDPHTGDRQQLEALSAEELPTFELFRRHCRAAGVEDVVDARLATSLEVAANWSDPIDLLYVDGWHSYDAVIADGEAWLPFLSSRGAVVFDDYLAYDEVREAVDELAARGLYRPWGQIFGQAIGGASAEPPATLRRALLLSRGGVRRALAGRRMS